LEKKGKKEKTMKRRERAGVGGKHGMRERAADGGKWGIRERAEQNGERERG
jgi:hypothetical protein